MKPLPILFMGDAPSAHTGLARIGRDLASLLSASPKFRVGYLGLQGNGSRHLPFVQYNIQFDSASGEGRWGEITLPEVWHDFAKGEAGVIFTIWDATRLHWFARPEYLPYGKLKTFLESGQFARWGYFPVDGPGPGGVLTGQVRNTLRGYDRVLAYTKWSKPLLEADDWLPHGMNLGVFKPRLKMEGRAGVNAYLTEDDYLIGHVGTNQLRKDWGLVAATCAELRKRIPRLRLWWHVDVLKRHWNIPALLLDYGLGDITTVTQEMNDTQLSHAYSACDLTLSPSPEGFGYAAVESLACGTPCIGGDFAATGDLFRQFGLTSSLVAPVAFRLETQHNVIRPVYDPNDWVEAVMNVYGHSVSDDDLPKRVEHLGWDKLFPVWRKWFETGVIG